MKNFTATIICLLVLAANIANGQTTLDDLQRRIRERTGQIPPTPALQPAPAAQQSGYLGLIGDDKNDRGRGVRVLSVTEKGPAAVGGFLKDDLITAIDGVRVRQISEMADILSVLPPGKNVAFDITRGDKPQKLTVTLGIRANPTAPAPPIEAVPLPAPEPIETPTPPAEPPAEKTGGIPLLGPLFTNPDPAPQPAEKTPPKAEEPPKQSPPTIEQLLQRIEELERRVKDLEKALAEKP